MVDEVPELDELLALLVGLAVGVCDFLGDREDGDEEVGAVLRGQVEGLGEVGEGDGGGVAGGRRSGGGRRRRGGRGRVPLILLPLGWRIRRQVSVARRDRSRQIVVRSEGRRGGGREGGREGGRLREWLGGRMGGGVDVDGVAEASALLEAGGRRRRW